MRTQNEKPRVAKSVSIGDWERRTAAPLLWISVLFLVVLSMPTIRPGAGSSERLTLRTLNIAIWVVFALDYLVRLRLAEDRRSFVRRHPADLAVVLLPALRPLRLLRLLSLAQLLARRATDQIVMGAVRFVATAAVLLVFVASVGVLNFERPAQGSNITNFGDAVWWSATTITTVGYGDHFPVTWQARLIAVALMLTGVALLGVLTASIAAWFVAKVSHEGEIEQAVKLESSELEGIRERLSAIEALLRAESR